MAQSPATLSKVIQGEGLTLETALAIGRMVGRRYGKVCIGSSSTNRCDAIVDVMVSALVSEGADVINMGLAPSPAIASPIIGVECIIDIGSTIDDSEEVPLLILRHGDGSRLTDMELMGLRQHYESSETPLPGFNGLGRVRPDTSLLEGYLRKVSSMHEAYESSVVICGTGIALTCARRLFMEKVSDLTCITSDAKGASSSPGSVDGLSLRKVSDYLRGNPGGIGICLSQDGMNLSLVDEQGNVVDNGAMLSLLAQGMGRSSLVMPLSVPIMVEDSYNGRFKTNVYKDKGSCEVIRTDNNVDAVVTALKDVENSIGTLGNGSFSYPSISFNQDALNTSLSLVGLSVDNMVTDLVSSMPRYKVVRDSVKAEKPVDLLMRDIPGLVGFLDPIETYESDAWWVRTVDGRASFSIDRSMPNNISIMAESEDEAYAISLLETMRELFE